MVENQVKHLEMVQGVIDRMANNSFLLKGWSITLVAAILAAYASQSNPSTAFALLALFPALVFWGLDAFYLRTERKFRKLHDDICDDISVGTANIKCFSMDISKYDKTVKNWLFMLFAHTVWPVHSVVVIIILLVAFTLGGNQIP